MTIDPLFLNESSTIAYPEHFYPADIEVSHHQLRNFISTAYDGKIFYVNKYDIFILDLESHSRTLLVTVPFEARCLAAAHGWVCVGGETKGDCAFIHIGEENGQPGNFCHELIVEMLGKEIVNAMNIQLLKPQDLGGREEVVVLISNNDHTVTVFSLCQRVVLTTIEHPQPMNYASLSPDSTIMAAVGDENKVYFLQRSLVPETVNSNSDDLNFPEYDWRPLAAPDIPRGSIQPEDFSFAVAFSPDGQLCAVSSQGGAITVFDMQAVEQQVQPAEKAIICTFRSSRESLWGCVRSMSFSPASWNILAWAEDHGRIGLADVRQGFQRRQHLHLNKEKTKRIEIQDASPAEWRSLDVKERLRRQHDQRMEALRGSPPVGARLLSNNRQQPNIATNINIAVEDGNNLSERERSVIQALDTTINEADSSLPHPYSINYSASRLSPRSSLTRPSTTSAESRREYEVHLLNSPSRNVPSYIPRREMSVLLSESQSSQRLMVDESSRMTMTASPGPISDDGMPPPMSTNDLTPASSNNSSQPLPYNIPPSDPWHVIEANLASRRGDHTSSSLQPAGLQQIENAIRAERDLGLRLTRQLSEEQRISTILRSHLDIQQNIGATQQESHSRDAILNRYVQQTTPAVARQLLHEHDYGQRRAEELEDEIRNMSARIDRLLDERDSIIQRHRNTTNRDNVSPSTARSSALPTTLTRIDLTEIEERMQRMEDQRRLRVQRISDLEQAVRRAESTIALVSRHNEMVNMVPPRDRPRTRGNDRDDLSTSTSRLPPVPQTNTTSNPSILGLTSESMRLLDTLGDLGGLSPTARRLRQRTAAEIGINSNRSTVPRVSELANRVTDSDLRLARMMMQRHGIDVNGNWRRIGNPIHSLGTGVPTTIEDIVRESGVGTAGIGWSPDGLKLYAGTEQGIFEFKLNIQDRLQHPLIEMR